MPTSVVTITINPFPKGYEPGVNNAFVRGTLAIGAGNYATNGLALSWAAPLGSAGLADVNSLSLFQGYAYSPSTGYEYTIDSVNGTLRIYQADVQANTATLVAGAATVTFAPAFAAVPVVALGPSVTGNTYKATGISATGFTLTSSLGTDTSAVGWLASVKGGALAEFGNLVALPAAVTGDTIYFEAIFLRV